MMTGRGDYNSFDWREACTETDLHMDWSTGSRYLQMRWHEITEKDVAEETFERHRREGPERNITKTVIKRHHRHHCNLLKMVDCQLTYDTEIPDPFL